MKRWALFAAMALLLTGCGALKAPPTDSFYRLDIAFPDPAEGAASRPQIVFLPTFQASGLHGERALVFAHKDGTTLEQFNYHFWIESPRQMLQIALAQYLPVALGVETVTEPARSATHIVQGRLIRFEQAQDGTGERATAEIEFKVYAKRSEAPLFTERYRADVDIEGTPAAIAKGLSVAIASIYSKLSDDLRGIFQ